MEATKKIAKAALVAAVVGAMAVALAYGGFSFAEWVGGKPMGIVDMSAILGIVVGLTTFAAHMDWMD